VVKLLRCYSQAPDLAILEGNMNEAITVYLKAMLLEAPLLSFIRTWQVKVTTHDQTSLCALHGVARVLFPGS
jgi:hypothetical protein